MKKIVIIGATSAVATETARCFALEGAELFIAGRSEEKLERLANDLRCRGAAVVHTGLFNSRDLAAHDQLLEHAFHKLGEIDAALIIEAAQILTNSRRPIKIGGTYEYDIARRKQRADIVGYAQRRPPP